VKSYLHYFSKRLTAGTDCNQKCSITFNCGGYKGVSAKEKSQEQGDEGDFTDELLDDEVEDDEGIIEDRVNSDSSPRAKIKSQ
jgi:hypothetical protein